MFLDYDLLMKGVVVAYMALLAVAAACDAYRFKIPNVISLCLVVTFVVGMCLQPFPVNWSSHIGSAALMLAVGLGLFGFGVLGGGDAKLITAVALWSGLDHLPQLLMYIGLAGGAVTILLYVFRRVAFGFGTLDLGARQLVLPRVLVCGEQIPYGLAIAAGGIYLAFGHPQMGLYLVW